MCVSIFGFEVRSVKREICVFEVTNQMKSIKILTLVLSLTVEKRSYISEDEGWSSVRGNCRLSFTRADFEMFTLSVGNVRKASASRTKTDLNRLARRAVWEYRTPC